MIVSAPAPVIIIVKRLQSLRFRGVSAMNVRPLQMKEVISMTLNFDCLFCYNLRNNLTIEQLRLEVHVAEEDCEEHKVSLE
jgi:hypothetical protein